MEESSLSAPIYIYIYIQELIIRNVIFHIPGGWKLK